MVTILLCFGWRNAGFISQFFAEISPTLLPVPGVDTLVYQKKLVERFGERVWNRHYCCRINRRNEAPR